MTTTTYLWDTESDNLLSEDDGSSAMTYTNEPGQFGSLVSQNNSLTSNTNFYHFDARGDTRELTDVSQAVTDTQLYDDWGSVLASTGATIMPFRWVGRLGYYLDHGTGLDYVRERYYHPGVSRWLSTDPQEWYTYYKYVDGNPTTVVDPSGLDFIAVADRRVGGIAPVWHYSLQYWQCCVPNIQLCKRDGFSKREIENEASAVADWVAVWGVTLPPCVKKKSVELLAVEGFTVWATRRRSFSSRREWTTKDVWLAVIQYTDTSNRIMPIFEGTRNTVRDKWEQVEAIAKRYRWAEQDGTNALAYTGPFPNWPRSMYKSWQTNSNTFVRHVATSAGLRMCEMKGSHPGDIYPSQNTDSAVTGGLLRFFPAHTPWKPPLPAQPKPVTSPP